MDQADLIWMNGEFVAWEDAKVHVLTHGLHYGTGVFEGDPRATRPSRGPAIFRHHDHLDRLYKSAELYYMPIPYSREELRAATHELIARNGLRSCYIRPIAFRGYGHDGPVPARRAVDVAIAAWQWGAYLGDEGKRNGVRAKVSSWRRISPDSLIPHAKASGQYLNSVLAKIESTRPATRRRSCSTTTAHVCEGSGENIFVVRDGVDLHAAADRGDPRRHQPQVGHPDRARPRLRGRRARHRARRAVPRRRGLHDRHRRRARRRSARSTTTRSATARPGRVTRAAAAASSRTRCTAATERYREWLDVVDGRGAEGCA